MSPFQASVEKKTVCKCCGAAAELYGVVDFHKNCHRPARQLLGVSGVPIYYYRCTGCQFIFTKAFDQFTVEDLRRYIYNDDYLLVDPQYLSARPQANAAGLAKQLSGHPPQRILDYGGGHGVLAENLRSAGFPHVDTYDPFVPAFASRPRHRYDCIVSFEVVEHATDPAGTFADMDRFLAEPGLILFSTLLQPADIDQQELNWWYAAPRNGHVSLHTRESLAKVAAPLGLCFGSFDDSMHVLFRRIPEYASRFFKP